MPPECPQCGGSDLRQITPGFFECLTQVQVGAIPPGAHGNREYLPVPGPFRHRFQVGSGNTEPCFCGRDSIGTCKDCARRFCGLHGSSEGEFLCESCVRQRSAKVETARRERYEAEVAVVRVCTPITDTELADAGGPAPDPPLGQPLGYGEHGLGEHRLWQALWADGERKGYPNLVGLMWTERYGGGEDGEHWQIVHHHTEARFGQRKVRKGLLRKQHYEQGITRERDSWTAYAYWPATGCLCDIEQFTGVELSDHWTSLGSRAGGSALHDLRWAPPPDPPAPPDTRAIPPEGMLASESGGIFLELEKYAAPRALESWLGLWWIDYQGRRCTVVDDALVQANTGGLPPVYRAILIEKTKDGRTVAREVVRGDAPS